MSKVVSVIESVFTAIQGFAKANPALAAGAVSLGVTLLAHFGLNVSPGQLVTLVVAVNGVLAGLVHVSTEPRKAGGHEDRPPHPREEFPS